MMMIRVVVYRVFGHSNTRTDRMRAFRHHYTKSHPIDVGTDTFMFAKNEDYDCHVKLCPISR